MELRKICSQRRNDRKIQKRKEEREAKVQAAIEAWKNELT